MYLCRLFALGILFALTLSSPATAEDARLDAGPAARFAELALDCVHKEYPNKIAHVLSSDEDVRPPRELTPAFYGCYDWHSAVHGHWLLARLARTFPRAEFAAPARAALEQSLQPEKIERETAYLAGEGSLGPLEREAAARLTDWLPKLSDPIRVGEHSQTAFAFGLILDWAQAAEDRAMIELLDSRIRDFYLRDSDCPLEYEPSGQDFLSPCLAEADLMRRILEPTVYAAWLGGFLPQLPFDGSATWLEPAVVTDPEDPKLAHLDGLNLSRAWMLDGMAAGLPPEDPRLPAILAAAAAHREAGLRSVTGEHYEGGHWLGSFATYLVTGRGLATDK
jgi:hypothetical protein